MNPTLSPFDMPAAHLGLPIKASRGVAMGEFLMLGPLGFVVHPVDYEKLLDHGIDDFEAVRRAAVRSFDGRWNRRVRNAAWARESAA